MQDVQISKVNAGTTQLLNTCSKTMTPHTTHLHDKGHLHCTLPIHSLPPEEPNYQPCTKTMTHPPFQRITESPSKTLDQKYPVKPRQQHSNHKAQQKTTESTWLASDTVMRLGVNKTANQELTRQVQQGISYNNDISQITEPLTKPSNFVQIQSQQSSNANLNSQWGKSISKVFIQATSTTKTPYPFSLQWFLQRYNVKICLQQNKKAISKWEAINSLFQKILMVDPMTVVYPWQSLTTHQSILHLQHSVS